MKRHGGKVTAAVSGRTSYVLVGMDCGPSKIKKAKEHGTALLDEDGLFAMVTQLARDAPVEAPKQEQEVVPRVETDATSAGASASAARPSTSTGAPSTSGGPEIKPAAAAADSTPLWVNKYKPSQPAQLIGNGKNIADLRRFLTTWHDVHVSQTHPSAQGKGKDKPMKVSISHLPHSAN